MGPHATQLKHWANADVSNEAWLAKELKKSHARKEQSPVSRSRKRQRPSSLLKACDQQVPLLYGLDWLDAGTLSAADALHLTLPILARRHTCPSSPATTCTTEEQLLSSRLDPAKLEAKKLLLPYLETIAYVEMHLRERDCQADPALAPHNAEVSCYYGIELQQVLVSQTIHLLWHCD
jgi:hypothetical protein